MAAVRLDTIEKLKDIDSKLIIAVIIISLSGLLLIYSADHAQDTRIHFMKQSYFLMFSMILLTVAASIPIRVYYALAYVIYGVSLALLVLVFVLGVIGFGAKRWIGIGGFGIQPSEFAKIAFILAASRYLSYKHGQVPPWKAIGIVGLLGAIPTFMILLQPDLGTATLFPVLCAAILAWFGLPLKFFIFILLPIVSLFLSLNPWFVTPVIIFGFAWLWRGGMKLTGAVLMAIACGSATIIAPLAWSQLEPYQQIRLTTFLDPTADPLGAGYQVIQSKVAIGSGGTSGQGFLEGTQTQLKFLPQQHTDFIFALAGEEFGFLGVSFLIALLMFIIFRGYRLAGLTKNEFAGMVAAGISVMIFYHAVVNIGMVVGVLPVTGLPLPFLSYGGSFLFTCIGAIGILVSVGIHRRER